MLISIIALIQCCTFIFFFMFERVKPARELPRSPVFWSWWCMVLVFSVLWVKLVMVLWPLLPSGFFTLSDNTLIAGFMFYGVYSFFNYWWHRYKHMNAFLWKTLHRFHHAPQRMETAVTFFKHPLEIVINSSFICLLAIVFNAGFEVVAIALAVEGVLETYHHSNIKTPRYLRWLGYVIQTPEMHLVHHERGLHRFNYVAFLWDSVFGTVRIPEDWKGQQGLKNAGFYAYFVFWR